MAVSETDCQTFLKSCLNETDVTGKTTSKLKCLICGKRAYQYSSYVYCTSNLTAHRKTNLDYMIKVTESKVDILDALESYTFKDKAI